MALTIIIPAVFSITALDRFTREIVGGDGLPTSSNYVFDFARLNYIDGTGYTVLSNTIEWIKSHGAEFSLINYENLERPGITYLDDCGFFWRYTGSSLISTARARRSTIPCTKVEHANGHGWLEYTLSPWMSDILHVSHGQLGSVRAYIKELFNNIDDHSTKDTGFVHAQHYPGARKIHITVSDFGRGIPSTIRERFGEMKDGQAILYATQEGVTAKTKPNNMGAGLNYLVDRVTADQGIVNIRSLSGSLNCYRGKGDAIFRRPGVGNGTYPGTLVDIALDTRLFVGDDEDRTDLEW